MFSSVNYCQWKVLICLPNIIIIIGYVVIPDEEYNYRLSNSYNSSKFSTIYTAQNNGYFIPAWNQELEKSGIMVNRLTIILHANM